MPGVSHGQRSLAGYSPWDHRASDTTEQLNSYILPGGTVDKNPPANAGDIRDVDPIPPWGRSPGEGNGNPLQYSCLEYPMDRGAWRVTTHGVAKESGMTLSD